MADALEQAKKAKPPKTLGQIICTVGVCMFAGSIVITMFLGIGGALFHKITQLGGLAPAIGGAVMWKVFKK